MLLKMHREILRPTTIPYSTSTAKTERNLTGVLPSVTKSKTRRVTHKHASGARRRDKTPGKESKEGKAPRQGIQELQRYFYFGRQI